VLSPRIERDGSAGTNIGAIRSARMGPIPVADYSFVPFYAQLQLYDPSSGDPLPEWTEDSLDQGVAAGRSGLTIATRSDFEPGVDDLAEVRIRVWVVGGTGVDVSGELIHEGRLRIGAEGLLVGSVVGNDLRQVSVPAGDQNVKVYVSPRASPELVDVVIGT
jgi:hypothetical protein